MEKVVQTLRELEAEAADFVRSLMPGERATLVTLVGELGAGKTAFTKSVAKAFGVEETVNSPTFVLEKIYFLPRELGGRTSKFARLVHIDAYRLEKGSDLAALGFDELLQDPGNLIMLEWPENVAEALPAPAVRVMLTALPDGSHTLAYG